AARIARDQHVIGMRLDDAGGDRADADLGHELHADPGVRIRVLQVVDELREILDRVDVVVRRRADQPDARRRVADPRDRLVDLAARQLAALAGLRALRHLDLQLVGVREIPDCDAEAPGRDLLDRRAARVAGRQRLEARRVLAAFAGIALAAQAIHRDRERLVRLGGDRAEAHRAGAEALHDLARGLDLVERNRWTCDARLEVEQAAQRARLARRLVHVL